jgi:hypothetical protein
VGCEMSDEIIGAAASDGIAAASVWADGAQSHILRAVLASRPILLATRLIQAKQRRSAPSLRPQIVGALSRNCQTQPRG